MTSAAHVHAPDDGSRESPKHESTLGASIMAATSTKGAPRESVSHTLPANRLTLQGIRKKDQDAHAVAALGAPRVTAGSTGTQCLHRRPKSRNARYVGEMNAPRSKKEATGLGAPRSTSKHHSGSDAGKQVASFWIWPTDDPNYQPLVLALHALPISLWFELLRPRQKMVCSLV